MSVERAPWGQATPTRAVTLRSGDMVVVQLIHDRSTAERIIKATRVLIENGIAVPRIRRSRTRNRGTFIVFDRVVGAPGPALIDGPSSAQMAESMGGLLAALRTVSRGSVTVDPPWASARHLADASPAWVATFSDAAAGARLETAIGRLTRVDWTPILTHGDFVPANVLVREDGSIVMFDLGAIAERHPLLDEAWCSLIVRYHHAARSRSLSSRLRAGAGIGQEGVSTVALADVAAVRAAQLHAEARPGDRPHLLDLTLAALSWADDQ